MLGSGVGYTPPRVPISNINERVSLIIRNNNTHSLEVEMRLAKGSNMEVGEEILVKIVKYSFAQNYLT